MPRYTLKLDPQDYEQVRREARREDRSVASMLRRLISEALRARTP